MGHLKYLLFGTFFGFLLVKAEVISWFRMQEMFRFQSFHMYGVIGSAVVVGAISVWMLKRAKLTTLAGEPIQYATKAYHPGIVFGGLMFGLGWAITGACPGPLYAQIGAGYPAVILTLFSALAGTWLYGALAERLLR